MTKHKRKPVNNYFSRDANYPNKTNECPIPHHTKTYGRSPQTKPFEGKGVYANKLTATYFCILLVKS